MKSDYHGRFAPSPTGPLHFGSLVSAVCSFLDARAVGGKWSVRIEDIDPPREVDGAASSILKSLDDFGMSPDEPVLYQSTRTDAYLEVIASLKEQGLTYPCSCSRKDIRQHNPGKPDSMIYPGSCRNGVLKAEVPTSTRLRVTDGSIISFTDRHAGKQTENIEQKVGDFIIQRSDGLFAYQLAVVVDDAFQGITHIVRGSDLLENTARQIYLQQQLSYPTPAYLHHPIALDSNQNKLSKQSYAPAVDSSDKQQLLYKALLFLGQRPPPEIQHENISQIWEWAIPEWDITQIPQKLSQIARYF